MTGIGLSFLRITKYSSKDGPPLDKQICEEVYVLTNRLFYDIRRIRYLKGFCLFNSFEFANLRQRKQIRGLRDDGEMGGLGEEEGCLRKSRV